MKRMFLFAMALLTVLHLPACGSKGERQPSSGKLNNENMNITIYVGNTAFNATIADSETGQAFLRLLPLTVSMDELNGNEKYHYLSTTLPTATYQPRTIEAGDLLLYGNNCVVLFYETFSSGYSYTRIGKIEHPERLRQALGSGKVNVRFERVTTGISSVSAKEEPTKIYNLQGVLLSETDIDELPSGVYIVKEGNSTKKIRK